MNNTKFQTEVLQRLAILETLIKDQDYKGVSKTSTDAYNLALQNKEEINELKEKNKWYYKTFVAAILVALANLVMSFIKIGSGIK